jgi:hypothetical protein
VVALVPHLDFRFRNLRSPARTVLFKQSVSLINENGVDLDGNPIGLATSAVGTSAGLPNRQYDCSRINRRR